MKRLLAAMAITAGMVAGLNRMTSAAPTGVPIYNRSTLQTGAKFNVSSGTANDLYASTVTVRTKLIWPDGTVQTTSSTAGGGVSGVTVYPATATARFNYGLDTSTMTAGTIATTGAVSPNSVHWPDGSVQTTAPTSPYVNAISSTDIDNGGFNFSHIASLSAANFTVTGATETHNGWSWIMPSAAALTGRTSLQLMTWDPATNFVSVSTAITDGAELGSTQTFTAAQTFASSVTVSKGLYLGQSVKTANYTLTSTDTVVLASCTANGGCIQTLPAASNTNQVLTITKVDTSSQTVTVKAAGSELIGGTTTQLFLHALNSSVRLASDGSKWWPLGVLPSIPPFIGPNGDPNTAQAVATSSNVHYIGVYVPTPCTAYAIRLNFGLTSGTADLGIYDSDYSGNPANKLASSGATTIPGTGVRQFNFTADVNLQPGPYWLSVDVNNTVATITRFSTNANTGAIVQTSSSGTLPTTASTSLTTGRPYAMQLVLRHGVNQ